MLPKAWDYRVKAPLVNKILNFQIWKKLQARWDRIGTSNSKVTRKRSYRSSQNTVFVHLRWYHNDSIDDTCGTCFWEANATRGRCLLNWIERPSKPNLYEQSIKNTKLGRGFEKFVKIFEFLSQESNTRKNRKIANQFLSSFFLIFLQSSRKNTKKNLDKRRTPYSHIFNLKSI